MGKAKVELEDVGVEAAEMPASLDDSMPPPATRPRGVLTPKERMFERALDELSKERAATDRRAERAAAWAAKAKGPKPLPSTCLGKPGGTRGWLTLDIPSGWSREDAMKPEALRLIAASPNLARSEKAVLALGAVGSKIDVQAENLSWGETWLVVEHVPSLDKMRVWAIPNTLWARPVETSDVQFETYTFKDGGLQGWHIHRTADGVLMTDTPFASAELARSYVLTTLHAKAIA